MNLFLLTAPYQILNALEAIHYFQFTNNSLWVIDTGHFTRAQFKSVIDPILWQSVRYYDFRYKLPQLDFGKNRPAKLWDHILEFYLLFDQFRKRQRADRITRSISDPIDNLILGNYQREYDKHMRHMANRLHFRRMVLLDVGTDTLRNNRDREIDHAPEPLTSVKEPHNGLHRVKRAIKRALVDWNTQGVPELTFFTTYELAVSGQDSVVPNEYAYLKSVVADAKSSDTVFFVGQPLVDQRYITIESFNLCMERIKEHFVGQRIVYIPHPRESEVQLHAVRRLEIEIQRFAAPFEYAVAFSGERPHSIASFFSSVVENSAAIFGDTVAVKAFRLPESFLLKDWVEVAQVYQQFGEKKSTDIEIVDNLCPAASVINTPN
jgi:hypothetical protein